jgi:hypothetical protein
MAQNPRPFQEPRRRKPYSERNLAGALEERLRAPALEGSFGPPTSPPDPDVFQPAINNSKKYLDRLEKKLGGPLPISLRSWHEQVGSVNLMGYQETLNPKGSSESAPDPLVIDPVKEAAEAWFEKDLEFDKRS